MSPARPRSACLASSERQPQAGVNRGRPLAVICPRARAYTPPTTTTATQAHVQLQAGWSQGPQRQCLHLCDLVSRATGPHPWAAHEAQQVEPTESLRPRLRGIGRLPIPSFAVRPMFRRAIPAARRGSNRRPLTPGFWLLQAPAADASAGRRQAGPARPTRESSATAWLPLQV